VRIHFPGWKQLLQWLVRALVVIVVLVAGFVLGRLLSPAESTEKVAPPTEQAPATVWTCSMHPEVRLDKPGLCPKCGMQLIPARPSDEGRASGMRRFSTSEQAKALMDIETAVVERKFVTAEIRMVGKVDYDETRFRYITAWVPGRLDRLYVDFTGIPVRKGDHMVYIYSPELYSAQEELLQALASASKLQQSQVDILREKAGLTVDAAREKLRLLGLTAEQVAEIEKRGTPSDHLTIYAPISGIVIHKNAQEGMYVNTGTRIYTVADLSQVWVKLDAYESDLMWLRYGEKVEFTTVSYPGEIFTGTISFIDPILNPQTRTVKVRLDVPNEDGKLKPEMFVKAVVRVQVAAGGRVMVPQLAGKWICPMHPSVIKSSPGQCEICGMPLVRTESLGYVSVDVRTADKPLVIPVSAALVTGTRAVVYVEVPDQPKPTYEGREIVLGPRAADYYLVRHGLREGEQVVVKGNFKIDSSLQIQAKPSMMTPEGGGGGGGHAGMQMQRTKAGRGQPSTLPAAAVDQLQAVLQVARRASNAVDQGDVAEARSAFAELGKAIDAVDESLLPGHAGMLWKELSMLLANDAVEGSEAQTLQVIQRVGRSVARNSQRLRQAFALQTEDESARLPAEVDPRFGRQVAKVLQHYFQMQQALAEDKAQPARSAAERLRASIEQADTAVLSQPARQAWTQQAASLGKTLSDAAKAEDLQALRKAFALLSEQIAELLHRFAAPAGMTVYELRCPMVFNNRGATWLQPDKTTRNPYFGSAMLRCGSVVQVISSSSLAEHPHE